MGCKFCNEGYYPAVNVNGTIIHHTPPSIVVACIQDETIIPIEPIYKSGIEICTKENPVAKLGAPLRLIQPEGLEFYEFYVLDETNVEWKAIVTAAKGTSMMEIATSLWDAGYRTVSAPDGNVDRLVFFTLEATK